MVKKGDTLVEVLLAVGIFSMIAIAVVAVMNGGTSEAQLALESTIAREEIDAQAEALRYIHASYINDKETHNNNVPSVNTWNSIIANAIELDGDSDDEAILQYRPSVCPNSGGDLPSGAFIIDTRNLNGSAYIPLNDNKIYASTATYPRLIFNNAQDKLIENNAATSGSIALSRAEGIYVLAVADKNTTATIDVDGVKIDTGEPSFYDFFIRTCWYGTDADTPSTISTVIRLHNPLVSTKANIVVATIDGVKTKTLGKFSKKDEENAKNKISNKPGWEFYGWCQSEFATTNAMQEVTCNGETLQVGDEIIASQQYTPIYSRLRYTVKYDSNGSSWTRDDQTCYYEEALGPGEQKCIVEAQSITRSGYVFGGWCDGSVDTKNGTCSGTTYTKGSIISVPSGFKGGRTLTLKAIWKERNEKITVKLTFSYSDCDSHVQGQKSDNSTFHAYYGNKVGSDVSGLTIAQLDHDYTSGGTETFTINTLGGRNYYYYVHNYSGCNLNSRGTYVTVSGDSFGPITYYSNQATGSGSDWNVFAYKDGQIVTPGANGGTTRSNSPNLSY